LTSHGIRHIVQIAPYLPSDSTSDCKTAANRLIATILVILPGTGSQADATICSPGATCYGVSQKKGFDTCSAPSTSVMSNWWPYSPYWDIGIYIGGSNRACPQPNLTSSWVQTVNQQGWDYYLTWVGPQSPCASGGPYNTYINNDVTTAYNQGKAEANAAISAASNLGIYGLKAYYYDLEAYNMSNETCRWAANSFVNGWS